MLRVGASGIKRTGEWSVPARMRVKGLMGSVVLDFCDTAIAHPVVEIELLLGTGSAELLVPDDATANVDALVATMGSVRSTVASQPRAGAPHFVVRGRARLGSVTVRRRRGIAGLRFWGARGALEALSCRRLSPGLSLIVVDAFPLLVVAATRREKPTVSRTTPYSWVVASARPSPAACARSSSIAARRSIRQRPTRSVSYSAKSTLTGGCPCDG